MPKFMTKSARLVSLFIAFFLLLFSFSTPLYATENTNPPTVTSITGPTSGHVGTAYQFSTTIESTSEYPLIDGRLVRDGSTILNITVGSTGCTTTSCTVTSTYTPTAAGTFYLYAYTGYHSGSSDLGCDSISTNGYVDCQSSGSKFITFVVTEGGSDDTLPSTGILSNQSKNIFIGLGFITLGILATQTFRIKDVLSTLNEKKSEKRKTKFEQKF